MIGCHAAGFTRCRISLKRSCVTCQGVAWRIRQRRHGPRAFDGPGPPETVTDPWQLGGIAAAPAADHHVGPAGGPAAAGSSAATPKAPAGAQSRASREVNAGRRDQPNAGKRGTTAPRARRGQRGTTAPRAHVAGPVAHGAGPEGKRERARERESRIKSRIPGFPPGRRARQAQPRHV